MAEEATQPLTQPYFDPHTVSNSGSLSEQDETDILCILMPSTDPAIKAVNIIADLSPQFILHSSNQHEFNALEYAALPASQKADAYQASRAATGRTGTDIALRMSNVLHNPCRGFVFGRHADHSDLIISRDDAYRVSKAHFRIFLTPNGVLMIEDVSRNGTFVDGHLISNGKFLPPRNPPTPSRWTLTQHTIIELPTITNRTEEMMRFIVRFPNREKFQYQYEHRLVAYIAYLTKTANQMQMMHARPDNMPPPVVMPFAVAPDTAEVSPSASILAAGTAKQGHGPGWSGGPTYNIVGQIGKGAFAIVYKLTAKKTGEFFAAKQLEKRRFVKDGVLSHKVHNEILVMKDLHHPNIVKYIEYMETAVHIYIVMEFVPYGDLSSYTEANVLMPEFICQTMALQIISALHYLHKRRITHRDIKPDNILVASNEPYIFKLSDFGLSKIVDNEHTFLKSFCGTLLYCAPEIYPGFQAVKQRLQQTKRPRSTMPHKGTLPYDYSVDTWSIAAVLFHLLSGYAPYSGTSENEGMRMLLSIMETQPNWGRLEQSGISRLGIEFVSLGLVIEPTARADEMTLLSHAWLMPTTLDASPSSSFAQAANGELRDPPDASQLSITDIQVGAGKNESAESLDELVDTRECKRSRYTAEPIDIFADQRCLRLAQGASSGPATPIPRLFGEINPTDGMRSSTVLGRQSAFSDYGTSQDESSFMPDSHTMEQASRSMEHDSAPSHPVSSARIGTNAPSYSEIETRSPFSRAMDEIAQSNVVEPPMIGSKGPDVTGDAMDSENGTHDSSLHARQVEPRLPSSVSSGVLATQSFAGLPNPVDTNGEVHGTRLPITFGQLVPIEGSIPSVPVITLTSSARAVTFGRDPKSAFVHPRASDDRIPKHAFDLLLWYPDIEQDIQIAAAKGIESTWANDPTVVVLISTRTSHYIKINGVRLEKGTDCWFYGILRTGDIISVFEQSAAGSRSVVTNGDARPSMNSPQFLKYRCEFTRGASAPVRETSNLRDNFIVQAEQEKFRKYQSKKREIAAANARPCSSSSSLASIRQ